MNQNAENPNHPELDDQLETAVWAVLSAPIPADAVERVKLRALQSTDEFTPAVSLAKRRQSNTLIGPFISAACLLAVLFGAFVMLGIPFGNSSVYAQAAKRLESLTSMVFHVHFSSTGTLNELRNSPEIQEVTYLAPSLHRIENKKLGSVQIIDRERNRTLLLLPAAKQAITFEGTMTATMDENSPVRIIEALLKHFRVDRVGEESIRSLGTQTHNGARLEGFESDLNGEIVRAWFDTQSHAPVVVAVRFKIPAHLTDGHAVSMWQIMSNIQLNVDVQDTDFTTAVPEGYEPLIIDEPLVASSPSPEGLPDVIEMLRLCAQANDSKFPLWLSSNDDIGTPLAIQKNYLSSLEKQITNEIEQANALKVAKKFGTVVGRAMAYQFSLRPENDWNYFGGARLNQPDRPILWFAPEADEDYMVLYADLTIHRVTRQQLPERPASVVRPSTPGNSIRVSTPRFDLPTNAIREFSQLDEVRKSGKQTEVEHLSLAWMPEFIESQIEVQGESADEKIVTQESSPTWKPERNGDSSRLEFLTEFTRLQGLDVSYLYLTQNDLETIGNLTGLQRLSLSGVQVFDKSSRRLTAHDLASLSQLTSLEILDLSQANFAGGLQHLQELPRLHTLYLSSFENLNDRSIAELSSLPRLETLVLNAVYGTNPQKTVTEKGLESLRNLPRLRTLYVGHHGKWTLPVDQLRELLPNVDVHAPTDEVGAR